MDNQLFDEWVKPTASFSSDVEDFSIIEHHDPDDDDCDDEKRYSNC